MIPNMAEIGVRKSSSSSQQTTPDSVTEPGVFLLDANLKDALADRIRAGSRGDAGCMSIVGEEDRKHALGYGDVIHGAPMEPDVILGFGFHFFGHGIQLTNAHHFRSGDHVLDVDVLPVGFGSFIDFPGFVGLNEEKQITALHFISGIVKFFEVRIPDIFQSLHQRAGQIPVIVQIFQMVKNHVVSPHLYYRVTPDRNQEARPKLGVEKLGDIVL